MNRRIHWFSVLVLALALTLIESIFTKTSFGCTAAVISRKSTYDGRPVVWRNLDETYYELGVYIDNSSTYKKIQFGNADYEDWGFWTAINERGLGTGNHWLGGSGSHNNSNIMWIVGNCDTVSCVETAIDDVIDDRENYWDEYLVSSAIPVIGTSGNAKLFEQMGNAYYVYNADTRSSYNYIVVRGSGAGHANTDNSDDSSTPGSYSYREDTARIQLYNRVSGGLTLEELMEVGRYGDPGIDAPVKSSSSYTIASTFFLGVLSNDNDKYATMFTTLGQPDYCLYIPFWTSLSTINEFAIAGSSEISAYAKLLYNNIGHNDSDDDDYMNSVFGDLQSNIAAGVTNARYHWFNSLRDDSLFVNEINALHNASAWAAYYAMKSAYDTRGSGRSCNTPPEFSSFSVIATGNSEVVINATFSETCTAAYVNWGDSSSWSDDLLTSDSTTISATHTYTSTGWKQISMTLYDTSWAGNCKFDWIEIVTDDIEPSKPTGLHIVEG